LDESKYSLLFDVSEGGLAVEGFAARDPRRVISLEFDMPEGSGCIQARAEIVWTSDSGYRTGLRFLELPETSRRQLRDWVASASSTRMVAVESEVATTTLDTSAPEPGRPLAMETKQAKQHAAKSSFPLQPALKPRLGSTFAERPEEFDSEGSAVHLASIFIAAAVMSSIAFLLGYYWRAGRPRPPVKSMAAVAQQLGHSPEASPPSPSSLPTQDTIPPILRLDHPGFVLQVAAMGQEANADALSNQLRKKNFSAFVFHRRTDALYRVAVGPYTDESAAMRIKSDLEQEGYKPILRPWSPE
jgi:hypothetical protein